MSENHEDEFSSHSLYQQINILAKPHNFTGCLESKDGEILMGQSDIIDRWNEYVGEQYDDHRPDLDLKYYSEGVSIIVEAFVTTY